MGFFFNDECIPWMLPILLLLHVIVIVANLCKFVCNSLAGFTQTLRETILKTQLGLKMENYDNNKVRCRHHLVITSIFMQTKILPFLFLLQNWALHSTVMLFCSFKDGSWHVWYFYRTCQLCCLCHWYRAQNCSTQVTQLSNIDF